MTMKRISVDELKKIAKKYGLQVCKVKGREVINIRKHPSPNLENIDWPEFERILKKHRLAVYKAEESDFVKIMKDKG